MGMVCSFSAVSDETIKKFQASPEALENHLWPPPEIYLDIDKSWQGLHFILAEGASDPTDNPLSWAILAGEEIGEDLGYGPARFLTPAQVQAIATSFSEMDENKFRAGFNPEKMDREVYPQGIWVSEGVQALDWLVEYFHKLANFYKQAAMRNDGMLVWLT